MGWAEAMADLYSESKIEPSNMVRYLSPSIKFSNDGHVFLTRTNEVLDFAVNRLSIRCRGLRGLNSANRFQKSAQPFSRFQRGR